MAFLRNIQDDGVADNELLTQYKNTLDIKVLAVLFQRYMDLLFGVCLKYLKQPEIAKDAVMQIFEELVKKADKHEIENFKGWLYALAKNYCLMQLRSPRNIKTAAFDGDFMQSQEDVHPANVMEKEAEFMRMEDCLKKLPAEQEQTVRLFYLENQCYKDIANQTGIEWNKVRSYIQNGRRNLKICMEKAVAAEESAASKIPGT